MAPSTMNGTNGTNRANGSAEPPRYLEFPELEHGTIGADSKPALNKWSTTITRGTS